MQKPCHYTHQEHLVRGETVRPVPESGQTNGAVITFDDAGINALITSHLQTGVDGKTHSLTP